MPASASKPPNFCFAGHVDVVPPGALDAWSSDPFAPTISHGRLFGRGAADMKAAIACFIAAAAEFLDDRTDGLEGSVSVLLTADEEGPAIDGTVKVLALLADEGEQLDACLVGEPTNARVLGECIKIGRRGSLNAELTVNGEQGHAAYPQRADNPIPRLLRMLAALTATPLDAGSEHFEPSILTLTSIDVGNPVSNVIPAEARARFNIRFSDRHTAESSRAWLEMRLAEAAGGRSPVSHPLFRRGLSQPTRPLQRARRRRRPQGHRSRAEARHLRRHVGRALHQGLLPGGRIRHAGRDRPQSRRERCRRRYYRAERGLPGDPSRLLRPPCCMPGLNVPGVREIVSSLYGAWRLARFDPKGMSFFDPTLGGFWRSFFAAVIVAPAYVVAVLFTGDGGRHTDPLRFGLAEAIGYVLSWVAFPLVMEWLSRRLGCRARYLSYITAYNWAAVIEHVLLLPVLLLTANSLVPDAAGQILWLLTLAFVLAYAWFVTRTALAVTAMTAVAIVGLDVALSYAISAVTAALE